MIKTRTLRIGSRYVDRNKETEELFNRLLKEDGKTEQQIYCVSLTMNQLANYLEIDDPYTYLIELIKKES